MNIDTNMLLGLYGEAHVQIKYLTQQNQELLNKVVQLELRIKHLTENVNDASTDPVSK